MPNTRPSRNADKAPAAKPAPKQVPPQMAGPAPAARGLADVLADPSQATPAQLAQLQRQYGNTAVQRLVQRAQAPDASDQPQVGAEGGEVAPDLQNQITAARGAGQSLDPAVGGKVGAALGANFSSVRVHTDAQADGLNRSLGAEAFTLGSDVFFSEGAYDPRSTDGQHLLAHELTHVAQQGSAPAAIQAKPRDGSGQGGVETPVQGEVEDEEDLSGAFQQLFGQDEDNQKPGPDKNEEEDEEDLSGAFQQLFGKDEDGEDQGPEKDKEEDDEDLSEAFQQLFGKDEGTGGGPTPKPTVSAPPAATWTVPVIPAVLNPASAKTESKSLLGKFASRNTASSGSPLSELLNIISVMYRSVQWDRFDARQVIKTGFTPAQVEAAKSVQETAAAFQAATDDDEREQAELQQAMAAHDLVKADLAQADGALSAARGEKTARVTRFLARVNDLVELIQMSLAKKKGDTANLSQMLAAAQRLQTQVENVNEAVAAIQRAVDPLKTGEQEAAAKVQAIKQALKAKNKLTVEDLDLDEDEEELDLDEEVQEPDLVLVQTLITPAWFRELQNVRFQDSDEISEWSESEELRLSARDGRPDSALRRLQDEVAQATENFTALLAQMDSLKDKKLKREDALVQTKALFVKLRAAFDRPAARVPNVVWSHRGWESRQLNLAGSRKKLDDWKKAHPDAAKLHQRLEQILRDDAKIIIARDQQLNRIT